MHVIWLHFNSEHLFPNSLIKYVIDILSWNDNLVLTLLGKVHSRMRSAIYPRLEVSTTIYSLILIKMCITVVAQLVNQHLCNSKWFPLKGSNPTLSHVMVIMVMFLFLSLFVYCLLYDNLNIYCSSKFLFLFYCFFLFLFPSLLKKPQLHVKWFIFFYLPIRWY
jgi:hypothetical protein